MSTQVERYRETLRDAADTINFLMQDYPNEMWEDEQREGWEQVGKDALTGIHQALSQPSNVAQPTQGYREEPLWAVCDDDPGMLFLKDKQPSSAKPCGTCVGEGGYEHGSGPTGG